MTQVYANDYFAQNDNEPVRHAKRKALSDQRTADALKGSYARTEGIPKTAPDGAPQVLKDYIDFYERRVAIIRVASALTADGLYKPFPRCKTTRFWSLSTRYATPC